jgi:tryptophan 2,3-dioxygenase
MASSSVSQDDVENSYERLMKCISLSVEERLREGRMASSSVSQDDVENSYERLERRSRIRTARARQINPQVP